MRKKLRCRKADVDRVSLVKELLGKKACIFSTNSSAVAELVSSAAERSSKPKTSVVHRDRDPVVTDRCVEFADMIAKRVYIDQELKIGNATAEKGQHFSGHIRIPEAGATCFVDSLKHKSHRQDSRPDKFLQPRRAFRLEAGNLA